jgi:hypothetical protein
MYARGSTTSISSQRSVCPTSFDFHCLLFTMLRWLDTSHQRTTSSISKTRWSAFIAVRRRRICLRLRTIFKRNLTRCASARQSPYPCLKNGDNKLGRTHSENLDSCIFIKTQNHVYILFLLCGSDTQRDVRVPCYPWFPRHPHCYDYQGVVLRHSCATSH